MLEVVVTDSDGKPTKGFLQQTYTDPRDSRVSPVLIVAQYGDTMIGLRGCSGEEPVISKAGDTTGTAEGQLPNSPADQI